MSAEVALEDIDVALVPDLEVPGVELLDEPAFELIADVVVIEQLLELVDDSSDPFRRVGDCGRKNEIVILECEGGASVEETEILSHYIRAEGLGCG